MRTPAQDNFLKALEALLHEQIHSTYSFDGMSVKLGQIDISMSSPSYSLYDDPYTIAPGYRDVQLTMRLFQDVSIAPPPKQIEKIVKPPTQQTAEIVKVDNIDVSDIGDDPAADTPTPEDTEEIITPYPATKLFAQFLEELKAPSPSPPPPPQIMDFEYVVNRIDWKHMQEAYAKLIQRQRETQKIANEAQWQFVDLKDILNKPEPKANTHKCNHCGRKFESKNAVKRHRRTLHARRK